MPVRPWVAALPVLVVVAVVVAVVMVFTITAVMIMTVALTVIRAVVKVLIAAQGRADVLGEVPGDHLATGVEARELALEEREALGLALLLDEEVDGRTEVVEDHPERDQRGPWGEAQFLDGGPLRRLELA